MIRQLVSSGIVIQDIAAYGGLRITQSGMDLLRGNSTFEYRRPVETSRGKKVQEVNKVPLSSHLSSDDRLLLDRLKALRLKLAKVRGVPAYVIFPDRSLEMMAQHRPATRGEFAQINGVGEVKLRDFADIFIAEITGKSGSSC